MDVSSFRGEAARRRNAAGLSSALTDRAVHPAEIDVATRHQEHGDQALGVTHVSQIRTSSPVRPLCGDWDHGLVGAYPLLLELAGRRAVVVGGGPVALRRARGLLAAGAAVEVIAPAVLPELAELSEVAVSLRGYADGDLDGAWLAHACADDPAVNAAVAAEAERRRIPCVRADDATGGSARTPAVTRGAGLVVAVGSAGAPDPARAAAVRDAVALLLETGELPLRARRPAPGPGTGPGAAAGPVLGSVALVGGGPGDPELITVRGRRLLAEADVVVVDRLAPRVLLDRLDPGVEIVDVGKTPHGAGPTQEQISALLVDRARAGKRVVRLKGGDPFVLGRGGEEVAACVRAGVPVTVVPGVTSAVAGPAAAGIPVTHRGVAADFAVVSGHVEPSPEGSSGARSPSGSVIDWQALADGPATLVLLMALDRVGAAAAELVKRGRPGSTPVAVVRRATLPDQQVLVATLDTVAAAVADAGLRPPAVVVVGEVVGLRDGLWAGAPPG
jgi:uroporphyrin-III C-methyltransferase / precorrin-2 dehydrogenase / sirohydrochlorin ferrochelatase